MRASPAFQVSLIRFGVWRAAIAAIAGASLALLAAWWLGLDRPRAALPTLAAAAAAAAVVWCAASLANRRAVSLRWDGRCWHLGNHGVPPGAHAAGELTVALDFGAWMLLRFGPQVGGAAPWRVTWLPVQRAGLASQWQALRCAVHAPRPGAPAVHGQAGP